MSGYSVRLLRPASSWSPPPRGLFQRKCTCGAQLSGGGACTGCSTSAAALQLKASGYDAASPPSHDWRSASGQPLAPATRAILAPHFGRDLTDVRVHNDPASHEAARSLNARAFTVGQHIHFADGEYDPQSTAGTRLLAHELAHTIQQQGIETRVQPFSSGQILADEAGLEREADLAADAVIDGRPARVTGSARSIAPQREGNDKPAAPQPAKVVEPVEPNARQRKLIDEARRAAAIRTQVARFKASGLHGRMALAEARSLAQIKFSWQRPNMQQISDVLADMGGGLISVDVKVAGAKDPECGSRSGYVRGGRPPIVLCPGFFKNPADTDGRIRTMVHEMAHTKGIGKAEVSEQYFPVFDCTSQGAFEAADSWSNYVHCLSGQTPDKAEEIVVKPPGGKAPAGPGPKK